MPITIGTRLGSLEVTALLGKGGMGEVYRARDSKLKRDVAIKVLPDDFADDADRLSRFQREAELLASLNHPNIAQVYGLEESSKTQFIIMELVEGDTLQERLKRGPIPIDETLSTAKEVAEALEAAHERNVIHRDLKPANIKVSTDGKVKVLDFGLAKVFDRYPATNLSHSPTLMSASIPGVILGTAAYMAPEQAKGGIVDQRSDIFAFGCVLYEMLTGQQAFQADSVSEILASVLKSDPDLSLLPPKLNPRLRELLRRCLEKNPRKRWYAAGDVRLELQSIINSVDLTEPELAARRPSLGKRLIPLAAGMVLAAALSGIAVWEWKPSSALTVARFTITLPADQQLGFVNRSIAISPDGTQIVYVANGRLYLRSISESEAKPILGTDDTIGPSSPVFSPDGRSIAFLTLSDLTLKSIPIIGGTASILAHVETLGLAGLSWSREGIVFGQNLTDIVQVSANGGEPKVLIKGANTGYLLFPEILPDGKTVLFSSYDQSTRQTRLAVQSLTSGARKVLIDPADQFMVGHYVATGHIVFTKGGTLFAIPFDLKKLEVGANPVPVVQGIRLANALGEPIFSISGAGSLIYVPGPIGASDASLDLAVSDRNGTTERLKLPARAFKTPRLSPDGTRVAFGIDDGADANIWIYSLSGATAMNRLTFGGKNEFPVWSPDGQRIAFQSNREGDLAIFSQRADGGGVAERLTKPDKGVAHAPESWSPNGDVILFSATQGAVASLWTFSLREKKAEPFAGVQSPDPTNAVFSPDGRWVAYHVQEPGKNVREVYVQPFPPTGARYQLPISRDNHHPLWSRDGKELYYIPGPGEFAAVSFTATPSVAFGNPVRVRFGVNTHAPSVPRQFDITQDGKLIGEVASGLNQSATPATPQINIVLNWLEERKQRVPVR